MMNEHQQQGGGMHADTDSGSNVDGESGHGASELVVSSEEQIAPVHPETSESANEVIAAQAAAPRASHAGADLAYRRNFLGLTEADIAARLKLSVRRVALLEGGDWQAFGSPTTLRGFVRAYAKTVGLDPDLMVSSLPSSDHSNAQLSLEPTLSQPLEGDPARNGRPFWASLPLWGALAVCAALVLGWMGRDMFAGKWITALKGNSRAVAPTDIIGNPDVSVQPLTLPPLGSGSAQPAVDAPAQPTAPAPALSPLPVQVPLASPGPNSNPLSAMQGVSVSQDRSALKSPEPSPKALGPTAPGSVQVKLVFEQESWVEVTAPNGNVLMSGVVPGGAERTVDVAPGTLVILGNAPAVKIYRAGKMIDLLPYTTKSVARLTVN